MDVEKMRRQAKRATDAAEDLNRAAWLASLTPEHRAIHEKPLGSFCRVCINRNVQAFADAFGRVSTSMRPSPTTPEDGKGATDE